MAKALIPRECRVEHAIRVVVHAASPPPGLLAVAAGWLVASLDDVDVAKGLWERCVGLIAGANQSSDRRLGWYREAAEGGDGNPRLMPRLELCLLAFHRMDRATRAVALADALSTFAGSNPAQVMGVPCNAWERGVPCKRWGPNPGTRPRAIRALFEWMLPLRGIHLLSSSLPLKHRCFCAGVH